MEVSPVSSRDLESGENPADVSAGDLKLGVTPLPDDAEEMYDAENKESANPRLILNRKPDPEKTRREGESESQGWLRRRGDKGKEKAGFRGRNLRAVFRNSPSKQPSGTPEKMETEELTDGFEIGEDLQLDAIDDDEASTPCMIGAKKRRSNVGEVSEDESSPMITSLCSNKVTFLGGSTEKKLNLVSDSAENGASPLFQQSNERRRLAFGSVLTQSGANANVKGGGSGARSFRRCVSMMERGTPPPTDSPPQVGSRALLDFTSPVSRYQQVQSGFKRPIDPCVSSESQDEVSAIQSFSSQASKRRRALHEGHPMRSCSTPVIGEAKSSGSAKTLSRSKSMLDPAAAAQIMQACSLADDQSNLTGDTRYRLSLPTVKGQAKNHDLKNIDCHTLANVIKGKYGDKVAKFRILDARYCYEYEGGHIRGAENFGAWDEEAFLKEFFPPTMTAKKFDFKLHTVPEEDDGNREILIFHCEFSSARGPALMRKLRNKDRDINKNTYPALHYPECYLLHEGYKTFYENYPELCDPQSYLPMAHPNYTNEERKFHRKSKSWAAGGGGGTVARTGGSSRLLKL